MKKGFREEFKHFKRKDLTPDFQRVVDFNKINHPETLQEYNLVSVKCQRSNLDWGRDFGMKDPSKWEIYSFLDKPGLIFIKNPFLPAGQRYWIVRCLEYYTRKPSKLNIDAHDIIKTDENWWEFCQRNDNKEGAAALEKLRWATFGYHHDWDTKVYSESSKCNFPTDLRTLCSFLAKELNFSHFNAEAAIVNMYHFGCSLSGHTDHSEVNVKAPLFSFSFGQSAVFLIGGKSIEDEAIPILLESGDIIIMSEESRLCYHGVPRILRTERRPWKEKKCSVELSCKYYSKEVVDKLCCDQLWEPFENYVRKSRINMNVRRIDPVVTTSRGEVIWGNNCPNTSSSKYSVTIINQSLWAALLWTKKNPQSLKQRGTWEVSKREDISPWIL